MALATSCEDSSGAWGVLTPSAELRRLEIIVRLDHRDEVILSRAVAPVCIGVMTLHEFLEARLDLGRLRIDLEPQRVEGLALGIAHLPRFLSGFLCVGASASAPELAQHVERIVRCTRGEVVDA